MQKKFDNKLCAILREAGLTPPSAVSGYRPRLLLAVSGGMDSMCLAELFLHSEAQVDFAVAHCNFHLREEESDSDAALVTSWGKKNGIQVYANNFSTAAYAAENGVSIEMAARELRYGWFGHVCEDDGFDAVVTAHHADDNAETMLLNIARGTGLKGLCGMSEISTSPYSDNAGLPLLRPLLGFTRGQIEGYVRANGVEYHEDSTNADSAYKRNLIRHEVIPLLKRLNPSIVKTLGREMKYFSQAAAIVEEYFEIATSPTSSAPRNDVNGNLTSNDVVVDIAELTGLPHWEYRLYSIMEKYGFNSATIASVEDLIKSERTFSGKTFHSQGYRAVTASGKLIIIQNVIQRSAEARRGNLTRNDVRCDVIADAGEYDFDGRILNVEVKPRSEIQGLIPPQGTLYFDAEAMPFPFVCRKWRDGDWTRPLGMNGRKKKISDLFTDLKYSLPQKSEAMLIAAEHEDSHVLALLGERIDESVKIKPETRYVLVLRLKDCHVGYYVPSSQ